MRAPSLHAHLQHRLLNTMHAKHAIIASSSTATEAPAEAPPTCSTLLLLLLLPLALLPAQPLLSLPPLCPAPHQVHHQPATCRPAHGHQHKWLLVQRLGDASQKDLLCERLVAQLRIRLAGMQPAIDVQVHADCPAAALTRRPCWGEA